ncbi:MAG: hypothetical protein IBX72_08135 [Nitrospirae bacterium]|jgi:hypothetical protein|nr:hypothetical protein [Nitrospirota bacterium]
MGVFVTKITFVLYICDAIKEYVETEVTADQADRTYPDIFLTKVGNKNLPDTYITVMLLKGQNLPSGITRWASG